MGTSEAEQSWRRFHAAVGDDGLRAVSAAFASVACADGQLDDREVQRFLAWIGDQAAFAGQDLAALEAGVRELAAAFRVDYDEAARRATEAIAGMRLDELRRELVLRAAQIAMVADERLEPVEETALARICAALGVDPADW